MNQKAFFNTVLVLFLCATSARSNPLPTKPNAPYILKIIKTIPARSNDDGYEVVRLFDSKTQKVIWTRKFTHDSARNTAWSKDGRALAMYLPWNTILVWRANDTTRFFRSSKQEDYIMGFDWSPDNRRLLIHSGSSGKDMTPLSHLFCLNISSKRMYSIHKDAAKVSWVGPRTVRYSILNYDYKKRDWFDVGKPRIWRSP